jgi:hypothetical protein
MKNKPYTDCKYRGYLRAGTGRIAVCNRPAKHGETVQIECEEEKRIGRCVLTAQKEGV